MFDDDNSRNEPPEETLAVCLHENAWTRCYTAAPAASLSDHVLLEHSAGIPDIALNAINLSRVQRTQKTHRG